MSRCATPTLGSEGGTAGHMMKKLVCLSALAVISVGCAHGQRFVHRPGRRHSA